MEPTELFIENSSSIQIRCTEATRNSLEHVNAGTIIYQTDGEIGTYKYNGSCWNRYDTVQPEPELTSDDISNIKNIPTLCTMSDVIQYLTDNKDVFETIKTLILEIDSKVDRSDVYSKHEIDKKLLTVTQQSTTSLKTHSGSVNVWTSPTPYTNQVLTAINKDTAVWADPQIPVTSTMYAKLLVRIEELERYQRETEAKKRLTSKTPSTNTQPVKLK
jgi:hypothetical protein